MSESTPQPRSSDAILGGQTPPPVTGAILGGLEGAKQRLESETLAVRMAALKDSLSYGAQGLDLVIQALKDPEEQVQEFACRLLKKQEQGRQVLLEHRPLSYFTTLNDWRWETYNPQIGITDPVENAYIVRMANTGRNSNQSDTPAYDLSTFATLIQDPRIHELQALIFEIDYNYYDEENTFEIACNALCEARHHLPNLKALFIGDSEGEVTEFRKSKLRISEINSLLEAFPKLEVLRVFGYLGDENYDGYTLKCAGLHHTHLKSLIIETSDIAQANIEQLCSMDLPELEYFELWFGRYYHFDSAVQALNPIFAGSIYPKLKYLGLCSSEEAKTLIQEIVKFPIAHQLAVLDLRMGTLEDADLEPLLDEVLAANLQVLDVTGNLLSDDAIARLGQQPYQVISDYQLEDDQDNWEDDEEYEDYEERALSRHDSLYE